ncbi:hypothetical protein [Arthrobacter sp. 92]|jgi:ABC-type glycerol-3-phosphate transport system substrate-binding protein|uniref:hypothetical protein n=1 Tax=Arthrobacter sp. 92 TaxID=3418175 RepID=UPI003D050B32
MKKTLTILIAAGTLLTAAGCSPAPQMSNAETCARIKTIVSSPTAGSDKPGMIRLANQLRPVEVTSSNDLKDPLKSVIAYLDESTKENPDSAKVDDLKAKYTDAGQKFGAVCGQ